MYSLISKSVLPLLKAKKAPLVKSDKYCFAVFSLSNTDPHLVKRPEYLFQYNPLSLYLIL